MYADSCQLKVYKRNNYFTKKRKRPRCRHSQRSLQSEYLGSHKSFSIFVLLQAQRFCLGFSPQNSKRQVQCGPPCKRLLGSLQRTLRCLLRRTLCCPRQLELPRSSFLFGPTHAVFAPPYTYSCRRQKGDSLGIRAQICLVASTPSRYIGREFVADFVFSLSFYAQFSAPRFVFLLLFQRTTNSRCCLLSFVYRPHAANQTFLGCCQIRSRPRLGQRAARSV